MHVKITLLILLIVTTTFYNRVYAQQYVNKIEINGIQKIDPKTITSLLPIKEGDEINRDSISKIVSTLYNTQYFSDVNAKFDSQAGILAITLIESPSINKVEFIGLEQFNKDDIMKELETKSRSFYSKHKIISDLKKLKVSYQKSGIFDATIDPKIKFLDDNRINIIFDIHEGKKYKIKSVNLLGNRSIADSIIMENIMMRPKSLLRMFSTKTVYDEDKLDLESQSIQKTLQDLGFATAKVKSSIAQLNPVEKLFDVKFLIDEGEKYNINEVTFHNNLDDQNKTKTIDMAKINNAISTIHKGDRFAISKVEKVKNTISQIFGNAGFVFSNIEYSIKIDKEKKLVDIAFEVNKLTRIYINKITIDGNFKTNDKVIRREILIKEGDIFDTSKLNRSIQRIKSLGYIQNVDVKEKAVEGAPDQIDLVLDITEGNAGSVDFSAAFASNENFIGNIGIHHQNLLGSGYNGSVQFQSGQYTKQNLVVSFTDPSFLDKELSFTVFGNSRNIQNPFYGQYKEKDNTAGFSFGYLITEYLRHDISYSYSTNTLDVLNSAASALIRLQTGNYTTSLSSHTITYDKRDNPFFPTNGYMFSLYQGYSGIGTGLKFLKHQFTAGFFKETIKTTRTDFVLSVYAKIGDVRGTGGYDVVAKDRFMFAFNEMRGFDFNGVGPRIAYYDSNGNFLRYDTMGSVRGNKYLYGVIEHTFPNFIPKELGFSTYLFFDAGTIFGVDGPTTYVNTSTGNIERIINSTKIRTSAGLGIGWKSPMGPIGISFGRAINKEPYDNTRSFRFDFGSRLAF